MIERTLVLLKPDTVQRNLVGEIISRFEKVGMKIVGMKMIHADGEIAGNHYADNEEWLNSVGSNTKASYVKRGIPLEQMERGPPLDKSDTEIGQWVRQKLIRHLGTAPLIAIALEGHNAVLHIRKMVGSTEPASSQPGTIRGDYSFDTYKLADNKNRPIQNLVHASGSKEEAERELKIWFKKEELHTWKRLDEDILYKDF